MVMKLTRQIPARTQTFVAEWCHKNWKQMTQRFREIRAKSRNPMIHCFWCNHEFGDGEEMALAHFKGKGNKTLCETCADELLASETDPNEMKGT